MSSMVSPLPLAVVLALLIALGTTSRLDAQAGHGSTARPATAAGIGSTGGGGLGSLPSTAAIEDHADPLQRPLSLAPRKQGVSAGAARSPGAGPRVAISTLVGGLAVCVGAFLLFVWATRRSLPPGLMPLPTEVVETLGRAPLNARTQLQLVRIGKKLILLCVSPQGVSALGEVSDAEEVERLAGLCQQTRPNSATVSFRAVLSDYARDPVAASANGETAAATTRVLRGTRRRAP